MEIKILRWIEKMLSTFLSSFATLGMFVLINLVAKVFFGMKLTDGQMYAAAGISLFLTFLLVKGLMFVRYTKLEILADEIERQEAMTEEERQAEEAAEALYKHLGVK